MDAKQYEESSSSSSVMQDTHEKTFPTHEHVDEGSSSHSVEHDVVTVAAPAQAQDGGDLEKHITNKSAAPSVNNVNAIPNGGLRAWCQVIASFFLFFNSWGIINTFGIYQTHYQTTMLKSSTPSDISWIGGMQAFLLLFIGPLTGPIYDAGHANLLVACGTFMVVFGQMMLSLCHNYWQVFLAQGLCVGIGAGMLFVPAVAILSTYFHSKLATAQGFAATGSSLGESNDIH